ncbi:MAG: NAD(P)/FAD-dependent oxidoreductase [Candidatus Thorarchaeota archaeon]
MTDIYDCIVVGGGPAGCSAALHLAYHDRRVLVLDRGTSPMHFHTNTIMNFLGGPTYHEGRTLLRQMQGLARAAGARLVNANVVEVSGTCPDFVVRTDKSYRTNDRSTYRAKTLIFATGTARKHPRVNGSWRQWLPVANAGNSAFYCPDCEAPLCRDKKVLVVNAGTVGSALHVANSLTRFTNSIEILMTEDAYVPIESQDLSRLDDSPYVWYRGKIKAVDYSQPGQRQSVLLESGEKLKCQVFFVAHVAEARSELARTLGVQVDQRGNILTDHRGKTNIEGIWAAGDVRPVTQQVAFAVGTGNYAALMVNQYLGNEHESRGEFDHPDCRSPLFMG